MVALAMSLVSSWVVLRTRSRPRIAFDYVAFLPHAVPHAILAFSALVFFLALPPGPLDLAGSLVSIIVVMALAMLSFGSRITNGALIQIHDDLEEAAQIAGASDVSVLRRILFPLLRPALLFGWLWIALLAFRELTIPVVLFAPKNITFSLAIWSYFDGGTFNAAAAASFIMMVLPLPLIILYLCATGKSNIPSS